MGQNSSSEQAEKPQRGGSSRGTPKEGKKIHRQISQKLPQAKGSTAADPSVSTTIATAQNISQPYGQKAALQYAINSSAASPDNVSKSQSVERSRSRGSPGSARQDEMPQRSKPSESIPAASPTVPMDVPPASRSRPSDYPDDGEYDRAHAPVATQRPPRPPRLPLPIADVEDTPESPTVPSQAMNNADVSLFEAESSPIAPGSGVRRQSSLLSNETQDDEEVGDELQPYAAQVTSQMVPTVIEWKHTGEKVYVTGTFANWERKFRLHAK